MMQKLRRYRWLSLIAGITSLLLCLITAAPSTAHWSDLATAEIIVEEAGVQMTLTYPTGLTAFADDNQDGQLSVQEIENHADALQTFLDSRIRLRDGRNRLATMNVQPRNEFATSAAIAAPSTHTTLSLAYTWTEPIDSLRIDYDLFVPNAAEASCLATILHQEKLINHVFTPQKSTLALTSAGIGLGMQAWLLPLMGAFAWGAVHSMSPGHGKTLIGAYLVGERATPLHAIFLAITTTVTHTLGVIALGLVTLFAARYVLPEQLYPWLSLISGSMVIAVGLHLLWQRSRQKSGGAKAPHQHSHSHHSQPAHHRHSHTHGPDHLHGHTHSHQSHSHAELHTHDGHVHSHLPLGDNGNPVTWQNLLMLGLSGGLIPCPAALVLLLGAIALGNPASGLMLVFVFSLGLASVLTGIGLLLVYAKQLFKRLPTPGKSLMQWLPTASAIGITLIGFGILTRSILQIF